MRILLVEDDHQLGESLEAALRLEQYAVDWLRSGEPVRAALAATPYDLLILDLGLPGVPGMLVLRQLRADKHRLPVLLLTARGTVADSMRNPARRHAGRYLRAGRSREPYGGPHRRTARCAHERGAG